jgi:hypothetical protein
MAMSIFSGFLPLCKRFVEFGTKVAASTAPVYVPDRPTTPSRSIQGGQATKRAARKPPRCVSWRPATLRRLVRSSSTERGCGRGAHDPNLSRLEDGDEVFEELLRMGDPLDHLLERFVLQFLGHSL